MKKLLKGLAALSLLLSVSTATVGAQAANTCSLSNTGPNSTNTCVDNTNNTVTVTCANGVTVANGNVQTTSSGTANVSGNTISGSATSGDTANVNAVATDLSQFCAAAPAAAAPVGGQGGGSTTAATPAPAGGQGAASVKALPATGASETVRDLAIGVAAISLVAVSAQVAVSGYRRFALK